MAVTAQSITVRVRGENDEGARTDRKGDKGTPPGYQAANSDEGRVPNELVSLEGRPRRCHSVGLCYTKGGGSREVTRRRLSTLARRRRAADIRSEIDGRRGITLKCALA